MKRLLLILTLCILFTGCASTQSQLANAGGHCTTPNVVAGETIQGLKVQWVGERSTNCPSRTPIKIKVVHPDEYMPPAIFKDLVERHEVNFGKVIALGFLSADFAGIEANKDIIKSCLLGDNLRAWSCLNQSRNDVYVNGYYRSNGTYVQGHYRTRPNRDKTDNYSYRGNVNPYTGKVGTQQ
jgi:hypothetical protein